MQGGADGNLYAQVLRRASNPEAIQRRVETLIESQQSLMDLKKAIHNIDTLNAIDAQIQQIQEQIKAVRAMRY